MRSLSQNSILFVVISLIFITTECHQQRIIDTHPINIKGSINQSIPIHITYKNSQSGQYMSPKIFSAKIQHPQNQQYLKVIPATISLIQEQQRSILPKHALSILEDLRTIKNSNYRHILIFQPLQTTKTKKYVMIYQSPNIILIYQEVSQFPDNLKLKNITRYGITDITIFDVTMLYQYNSHQHTVGDQQNNNTLDSALLTVSNHNAFYKLSLLEQYTKLLVEEKITVAYLEFMEIDIIVTAQYSKGVVIYQLDQKQGKANEIVRFSCEDLWLERSGKQQSKQQDKEGNKNKYTKLCSITDLSYKPETKQLYVLDVYSGVHKYYLEQQIESAQFLIIMYRLSKDKEPEHITQVEGCQTMDFISRDHFILICRNQNTRTYLLEVVEMTSLYTGVKNFIKRDPMFQPCNFDDIIATPDYYIAYDRFSIDVFWNSIENGLLLAEHTKQHINLSGLQTFKIRKQIQKNNQTKLVMYGVHQNILVKYNITSTNGKISIFSQIPVQKQIKIMIPIPCPQNSPTNNKKNVDVNTPHQHPSPTLNDQYPTQQCILRQPVNIIVRQKANDKHSVSISLGIIILMLMVLTILIWICCKKYSAMERYMKKILRNNILRKQRLRPIEI